MEEEIQEMKQLHDLVLNEQVKHYSGLLKEGNDCREFGVAWLIKSLWLLDQEISPLSFPSYLDRQSIQYLFQTAKMLLELDEY